MLRPAKLPRGFQLLSFRPKRIRRSHRSISFFFSLSLNVHTAFLVSHFSFVFFFFLHMLDGIYDVPVRRRDHAPYGLSFKPSLGQGCGSNCRLNSSHPRHVGVCGHEFLCPEPYHARLVCDVGFASGSPGKSKHTWQAFLPSSFASIVCPGCGGRVKVSSSSTILRCERDNLQEHVGKQF